jgi:hypothetical protein
LKAGVWFRRGRLFMVSPDSQGTACPPSGRNSTYRPVQISGTGSLSPAALVETGMYLEITTQFLAECGRPLYTVEGHPRTYGFAGARLRNLPNVKVLQGDSGKGVASIVRWITSLVRAQNAVFLSRRILER